MSKPCQSEFTVFMACQIISCVRSQCEFIVSTPCQSEFTVSTPGEILPRVRAGPGGPARTLARPRPTTFDFGGGSLYLSSLPIRVVHNKTFG